MEKIEPLPSFIGRYKILGLIGRGSMGTVYRGFDPDIGRPVALKALHVVTEHHQAATEELKLRFLGEARSVGGLRHPAIVTVYEMYYEGKIPYIVMEYLQGESLDRILRRKGYLPPDKMLGMLMDVAEGLDHAHARGVFHCDIKPANILLTDEGKGVILDFGIAQGARSLVTGSEFIFGSASYMSPEHFGYGVVGPGSDQFSLAVVAFECLTGIRPFPGDSFEKVARYILSGRRYHLHDIARGLPRSFDLIVGKALARDPLARFASCVDFMEALEEAYTNWSGRDRERYEGWARRFSLSKGEYDTPPPRSIVLLQQSLYVFLLLGVFLFFVVSRSAPFPHRVSERTVRITMSGYPQGSPIREQLKEYSTPQLATALLTGKLIKEVPSLTPGLLLWYYAQELWRREAFPYGEQLPQLLQLPYDSTLGTLFREIADAPPLGALPLLKKGLFSHDPSIRLWSIIGLQKYARKDILELLVRRVLSEDTAHVQGALIKAIEQISHRLEVQE